MLVKSGSTRLPSKNTLDFKGKPMFQWNLEKCLRVFGEVYVSSDSNSILSISEEMGAVPIKRPIELCGDTPNIPVYKHAFDYMKNPTGFIAVQANSPTIKTSIISMAKSIMDKWGVQEIMTCDENFKIYGSLWGLSKSKLMDYKDFYHPHPEVLIVDNSIDVHTIEDFNKALINYE
jgi:CMP-N-acetylneuraminic acid synthetase